MLKSFNQLLKILLYTLEYIFHIENYSNFQSENL